LYKKNKNKLFFRREKLPKLVDKNSTTLKNELVLTVISIGIIAVISASITAMISVGDKR
jgi:hypothetical protein